MIWNVDLCIPLNSISQRENQSGQVNKNGITPSQGDGYQADPAAPGRHVLGENTHLTDGKERTGKTGQRPAQDDRPKPDRQHLYAQALGGVRILADRIQLATL